MTENVLEERWHVARAHGIAQEKGHIIVGCTRMKC